MLNINMFTFDSKELDLHLDILINFKSLDNKLVIQSDFEISDSKDSPNIIIREALGRFLDELVPMLGYKDSATKESFSGCIELYVHSDGSNVIKQFLSSAVETALYKTIVKCFPVSLSTVKRLNYQNFNNSIICYDNTCKCNSVIEGTDGYLSSSIIATKRSEIRNLLDDMYWLIKHDAQCFLPSLASQLDNSYMTAWFLGLNMRNTLYCYKSCLHLAGFAFNRDSIPLNQLYETASDELNACHITLLNKIDDFHLSSREDFSRKAMISALKTAQLGTMQIEWVNTFDCMDYSMLDTESLMKPFLLLDKLTYGQTPCYKTEMNELFNALEKRC